ncbi:MAG: hypothetical protein JO024_06435 [Candidatus Eremiobacteraeota bacterium]|nr:hypothetical protein [Candidatus Eremiobacteraeota bacterium]
MTRILSFLLALAMCASLGTIATASTSSKVKAHVMAKHMSCPKGQMWVHPYMKNGKLVKGYCRKK